MTEAESFAVSLRHMASLLSVWDGDPDKLREVADFIDRQQAKIDKLEASLDHLDGDALGREK